MNFLVIALLVVTISAEFTELTHRSCGHEGTLLKVSAENFDVEEDGIKKVALFHVGNNPRIRIDFKPSIDTTKMSTKIKAKINNSLVEFPQTGNNACNFGERDFGLGHFGHTLSKFNRVFVGVNCPVAAGSTQTFIQEIQIQNNQKSDYNIPVRWEITNDQGKHEVCIIFLARVV